MLRQLFAMTLLSGPATGLLDARLESSGGKSVSLRSLKGKPTLVFYEDRDSAELNQAFKDELFRKGKEEHLLDAVQVVAVADLQGYDWFPARNFARDGVRDAEKKAGIPVYVDWDGTMKAKPWAMKEKTSNVVLLDADGTEVTRCSGKLAEDQKAKLFATLATLLAR
jgi:hypothetical protein